MPFKLFRTPVLSVPEGSSYLNSLLKFSELLIEIDTNSKLND